LVVLGVLVGVTLTVGVIPVVYVVALPPHPIQSANEVGVFVGVLDIVGVLVGVLDVVGVLVGVFDNVGVLVGVFDNVGVLVGVLVGV
jgi:hypothetical protein